jgi:hypothetical protein
MNASLLDASVFVSVSVAVSPYGFDSKKASGFVQIFGALAYSVAMRRLSILSHCYLDKLFCVEYSRYSLFQYKQILSLLQYGCFVDTHLFCSLKPLYVLS